MNFKKMLVIILIVVIAMFGMMLTTSYAWYSFTGAATTFDAVTSNKDIEVTFLKGEYINTTTAVPISSEDVDQYSDKHQFTVRTKNNPVGNEILTKISLVDITMNGSLQTSDFKIELYHQGNKFSTVTGNNMPTSGTKDLGNVYLDDDIDNQFEVRVYILDTGESQADLMNKTLSAKIQIDVVSRLKPNITSWDNPDIYVSGITIDGVESTSLPTTGYYSMTSTCTKGSTLTWDGYTKTITYNNGSYVSDSCSLVFTSATSTKLLSSVEPGSYVRYIGTNGCDGKHCEGQNANYVSDKKMGYCYKSEYHFMVNGWRVAYVEDGSAYLVSAGAPECVATYIESVSETITSKDLSSDYYYGSGYTFDTNTGKYTLTGATSSTLSWSTNYESILKNTPYTCMYPSDTDPSASITCSNMYKVVEYSSDTVGMVYTYYFYDMENGAPTHLARLNSAALEYCNKEFAYGGVCDSSSTWAMNATDFNKITGKSLSSTSCFYSLSDKSCGYTNDLIDNGSFYWYASPFSSEYVYTLYWHPERFFYRSNASSAKLGLRPVLRFKPSIFVASGSGTYEDPYTIYNDPNYVYVPEEDDEIIFEETYEEEVIDRPGTPAP